MPASFLSLLLMMLALGGVTAAVIIGLMAVALLRPPRMTDGRALWIHRRLSPSDLGFGYETRAFMVRDGRDPSRRLLMAGWWIPSPAASEKCVILLHDFGDAKVGAIAWAPFWIGQGCHVVAVDLRAHGESEGRFSTGGCFERDDLSQIINELRAEFPDQTRQLLLFGIGLGARVAEKAATPRDDVSGVVSLNNFAGFEDFARSYMDRAGFPGGIFQRMAIRVAQWLCGVNLIEEPRSSPAMQAHCPILRIDPQANPAQIAEWIRQWNWSSSPECKATSGTESFGYISRPSRSTTRGG